MVSPEIVLVQGEAVIKTDQLLDTSVGAVPEIADRLAQL
jgi:hypothetical protein